MVSGKLYIKDNSGNVQELKIDKERTVEFIRGTQTAAGAALTGATEDSALYDGKTIFYYLPFAAGTNATLNLTLSDETTTGEKPVFVTATTRLGTHYSAGSVISLTYLADKDGWYRSEYWNSNTYDRTYLNSPIKAATAVTAGTIIVGTASGYKMAASGVTFDLGYPILYASAAIAAAATNNATYLEIPNINLQTTKASWTGANNSIVYIVGTLSGNTVTIDSTVFTTTVPTSDDSKVYVPFGIMTSTTACYLMPMNGVYAFRNGSFGPLEQKVTVTGSGNAVTAITATNGVITATKGVTFATNGHTHTYPSLSVTTSGTGNVVDGLSVSNHAITLSKATTALLSATVSGTGNGITTASYTNGVLTLTKGLTFSTDGHTHTETQLSLATSGTGNGIADLSVSNHTITMTKTNFTTGAHPTIPNLSVSTSGTGNGISAVSVSGHAITITKAEFTTGPHPTVPTIPAITVATSGSGDAIIGISATNHAITATKGGSWSPSSHGLSATSTGTGNAFDTITVSNHSITMGKTTTFATTHSHPYLPLAGGTMSGAITANTQNIIKRSVNNDILSLYGGTANDTGARFELYGGERTTNGGSFVLTASVDSTNNSQLLGKPDGTLTWKGTAISLNGHTHSYVPTSRTVNGKALSSNISLTAADVGALATNGTAVAATTATKLGSGTVGSGTKPIFISGGSATAFTATVGSNSQPVWLNAGTIAACTTTFAASGHTHSYLPLSGGTMTGNITMSESKSVILDISATAPTANTTRDIPISIKSKDTDNNFVFSKNPFFEIPSAQTANNGMGVGFGAGGLTIIGAGESARAIVAADTLAGTAEKLVLTSDNEIEFQTKCNTIANRVKRTIDTNGNFDGNAANVTGTVAIDHGGTGQTTRLGALKALTNESVGTSANYFLTITTSWGKGGYTSVADAKTVLGLKSAAYQESSVFATAGHTHTFPTLSISTSTHGGNAVTAVSVSNHAITITKGITALTSHQSLSGYVPTSRTVNSKALSANISLTAADVGALASNGTAANSTKWNNYTLATVSTSAPSLTATNTANNNKIWLQYV